MYSRAKLTFPPAFGVLSNCPMHPRDLVAVKNTFVGPTSPLRLSYTTIIILNVTRYSNVFLLFYEHQLKHSHFLDSKRVLRT